jgi:ATP-binding cassette subfamily F protein uup
VTVSHDRYFLDRVVDQVVAIEDGEVRAYPGNYSDYLRRRGRRAKAPV